MPSCHVSSMQRAQLLFVNGGNAAGQAMGLAKAPVKIHLGWVGGRFGVIKTQRPTHPPLERNSEDHIGKCCDPKCYISKQTHHDYLMSKLSCIVKLRLLATTAMPSCHVSSMQRAQLLFVNGGNAAGHPHCYAWTSCKIPLILSRHLFAASDSSQHSGRRG